jgi:hypothetical protein
MLALAANLSPARAGAEELGESGKRAPPPVASPWSSSRIDLRGALASHDDRVTSGGQGNQAQGSAVTQLGLAGLWLPRESPFGVAADLALERFALTRQGGGADSVANGLEISSALVARLLRGRWALDGQLGYAFMRVPFAAADPATAGAAGDVSALQAHGPEVAARVGLAIAPFADIEARGRVIPKTFGARHGTDSASLQRYAVGAGARLGSFNLATWRLALLVDYDLVVSNADARDFTLDQSQHRVGLGLRAAWPAPVVIAPPPPIPAVLPPSGRVRGRVRAASAGGGVAAGSPLAGVTVTAADGVSITTDVEGRFVMAGRQPVLTRIAVAREGFTAAEEVVSIPRHGDVEIEILLHPDGPAPVGVLLGFVRGEDGIPVGAAITVRELKLSTRADRKGHFRLEVPPGRYELTIVAPNFERQTKVVVVGPGEQNIFNLDLQRHR